jgi:tRNA A-37 threonylcarbamoyl transferase component Bud32
MITVSRSVQLLHGQRFLVDAAWSERLAAMGIAVDREWTQVVGETKMSGSVVTRCYRMVLSDGEAVFFKRYVYPRTRRYLLEFWLRPGKAAVEAWAYRKLQQIGIPTLDVVAFGERRKWGMLTATFVVTKEVPNSRTMFEFARDVWIHLPPEERRRVYQEISSQLISQLQKAHSNRLFHHDLKWRNILIHEYSGHYIPIWIDAPRASSMPLRNRRGVVADLSCLARIAVSLLSSYDRMRFIWQYLGVGRRPGDAKQLYREVAAHLGRRPPRPLDWIAQ